MSDLRLPDSAIITDNLVTTNTARKLFAKNSHTIPEASVASPGYNSLHRWL